MDSKTLKVEIERLENEGDKFAFLYKDSVFYLTCWDANIEKYGERSYSVSRNSFDSMNVEKITDKYLTLYTFDMMTQKSSFKMDINLIELL